MKGETKNKNYLIGYRAKGITTYRTNLKPLGRIVAGLGFVLVAYGVVTFPLPTGSVFAIWSGFALLGAVGIDTLKKERKLKDKIRMFRWRHNLIW